MKAKAIMNWSGGKDSSLALHTILQADQFELVGLLTTVNAEYGRISMHGVREELLDQQAQAIGLPLIKIHLPEQVSMDEYDAIMNRHLQPLVENGVTHAILAIFFCKIYANIEKND